MSYYFQKIDSPIGILYLVAREQNLCAVIFEKSWKSENQHYTPLEEKESTVLKQAKQQLKEYFQGKRQNFDLSYELNGTDFQNRAWNALAKIPFGQTRSYKQQAAMLKQPKAVRAVGTANGRNPLSIVLPCHRVIGSNGSLTGYGGGLDIKEFLLKHEGVEF